MTKTKFKKGQTVTLHVNIGGITTYETATISRIDKEGVWLDNGEGNDESGPFDKYTGEREMWIGSQKITVL
jgi:hypothetical protein